MRNFFKEPFFYLGLLIKITLIFIVIPKISSQLYIPFLDVTSSNLTFDPWQYFIDQGGNPIAFPYGIAMWLTFLPGMLSAKYFNFAPQYGYQLTLLLADLFLLYVFSVMVIVIICFFFLIYIFRCFRFCLLCVLLVFVSAAIQQQCDHHHHHEWQQQQRYPEGLGRNHPM